ncbi:MAG: D-glycero-beta-D-manno-heptose-7-phosphate kinase [Deltaproteobacteria bacterium]|nr:D-glycero-beta-D-manno-heptose-7-phosphate kinase [Deltaproteobacteria bacterium]
MTSRKRALEIIDRFVESKVLVIGDIMVDQFIWGKVTRISPEAPVPVVQVTSDSLLLGGSSNVANNICSLGGKAALAGVIGADEMGRWFIKELRRRSIDTEGVIVEQERPTTIKSRIVAHNQQIVRFDREKVQPISGESVEILLRYMASATDDVGAVIISDYGKGMITPAVVDGVRKAARDRRIILCADPKYTDFRLYSGCHIVTPNHHEASRAAGFELVTEEDFFRAGKELIDRCDLSAVLITRGEQGMTLVERTGDAVTIPAVAHEVYDVTGAGDTVISTLSLALAAGATLREASAIANLAAGIVVGKIGTATVSRAELVKAV